jgi:hypothetical protein
LMENLIFASFVLPRKSSETNALLLAESIRAFAGSLSHTPIWYLIPEYREPPSRAVRAKLRAMNVTLTPFKPEYAVPSFPFIDKVVTASVAESMAAGHTRLLVWMDSNTLFLHEPTAFLLPDDKNLGFRPVHHTLIGSRFDEPLDPFWTLIYRTCHVPPDRVFPMMTHMDNTRIRPYFNTGLLVTRPETGLLQAWRDTFFAVYRDPTFQDIYQQDERYRIFMHQAVLSGVILSTMAPTELHELPPTYNYPLHLHAQDSTDHRPSSLEDLVTFRHEGFYEDSEWTKKMPANEILKQWIAKRLI